MARIAFAIVGLLLAGTGIVYAAAWNAHNGLATIAGPIARTSPAGALLALGSPAPDGQVTLTGTITYYGQQGVTVPYLVYERSGADIRAKALAYARSDACVTGIESPCADFARYLEGAYGAGPVSVTGHVEGESLIVADIRDIRPATGS